MVSAWIRIYGILLLTSAPLFTNASELLIGGSGTDIATMRLLAEEFRAQNSDSKIKVLPSLGSGGGIRALAAGRLHIGLSSRPLKPKESAYPIRSYLYARTPLVLATRDSNSASSISSSTFFKILSGEKHYWPNGQLIRVVLRPASDSDTLILIQNYALARRALEKAYNLRGIPVASSDQKAATTLESIHGSLGTTSLALIMADKRTLKPLVLDEIAPTVENLANGSYKMHKALYLVLTEDPDPAALKFVKFIQSQDGNRILRNTGHMTYPFTLD